MYRCCDCGSVFDEPIEWTEPHGEQFTGSPCCFDGYEEIKEEDDEEEGDYEE